MGLHLHHILHLLSPSQGRLNHSEDFAVRVPGSVWRTLFVGNNRTNHSWNWTFESSKKI